MIITRGPRVQGLPQGDRPEREAGGGALDLIDRGYVAERISLGLAEPLEIVELAQVDPLLDEEVAMDGDAGIRGAGRGVDLVSAGVRADHDGPLVLDEPPGGLEVGAGRVVLGDPGVVGAVLAPVP